MRRLLLLLLLCAPGCAYRIGSGITAGALDEIGGKGRSEGVDGTVEDLIERALLVELGHQLGQGLSSGATDISPEQQAKLEAVIGDLLTVTARKTGKGLRTEVGPELREMVQKDIVRALSEGLRGELGGSLEQTVDRVVARAVVSLRDNLADEQTRYVVSDLLRDSVYYAMREGQATPAVGETLQATLTENMLGPIEQTVGGLTEVVAMRVDASARRTENTLKGIISALVLLTSIFVVMYWIRNRQVRRLEEKTTMAERGLQNVDAALELLDEQTRATVLAKLEEYERVSSRPSHVAQRVPTHPPPPSRSDDYLRRG